MVADQLHIKLTCPVCSIALSDANEPVCTQCGWVVVLYAQEPGPEQLRRFHEAKQIRRNDLEANKEKDREQTQLEEKIKQLRTQYSAQQQRQQTLQQELSTLNQQLNDLNNDAAINIDFEQMNKQIEALDRENKLLDARLPHTDTFKKRPVSIQCTYDDKNNKIEVEVLDVIKHAEWVELDLGLAVAAQAFGHFSEADIIIPVKDADLVKVFTPGDGFSLALKHRPQKPVRDYKIIHLYRHTITQYTIQ